MKAIERDSAKAQRNKAVMSDPEYCSWLLAFIEQFKENCWIALMLLNGRPIAHYAGVCYKARFLGLHMAFLREYAKFSPGNILIFNILPLLRTQGIKEFDFGRGQSAMKARFTGTNDTPQFALYYFKKSLFGFIERLSTEAFWGLVASRRLLRKVLGRRLNSLLDWFSIRR